MTQPDLISDNRHDRSPLFGHRRARAGLLARTLVRLRPAQIAYRIRLRTLRSLERRWPGLLTRSFNPPAGVTPGWPTTFIPLDASLEHGDVAEFAMGKFAFLGETRSLGEPADWRQDDESRLWRFHLHYLEWAWALAQESDRALARATFVLLWRSWRGS